MLDSLQFERVNWQARDKESIREALQYLWRTLLPYHTNKQHPTKPLIAISSLRWYFSSHISLHSRCNRLEQVTLFSSGLTLLYQQGWRCTLFLSCVQFCCSFWLVQLAVLEGSSVWTLPRSSLLLAVELRIAHQNWPRSEISSSPEMPVITTIAFENSFVRQVFLLHSVQHILPRRIQHLQELPLSLLNAMAPLPRSHLLAHVLWLAMLPRIWLQALVQLVFLLHQPRSGLLVLLHQELGQQPTPILLQLLWAH